MKYLSNKNHKEWKALLLDLLIKSKGQLANQISNGQHTKRKNPGEILKNIKNHKHV